MAISYTINSNKLNDLVKIGQTALKGNSNDAEHDALYEIVTKLRDFKNRGKKKSNRTDTQAP